MSQDPLIANLPHGVRSRKVSNVNGLEMHILEAGERGKPCVVLLHGFPELAYSWRACIGQLAEAGYYVIAPDQRGYGRTLGWEQGYDVDLQKFSLPNLVSDILTLLFRLKIDSVLSVVGHDFGSPVAGWCGLIRPDIFHSVVLMSAPFPGAPTPKSDRPGGVEINIGLTEMDPSRKHYQWYYSTREADSDMLDCQQGFRSFLRAYFFVKSGDNRKNDPHPLAAYSAEFLAQLPTYYVMQAGETMAETVEYGLPSAGDLASCTWLTEQDLDLYENEFTRTGLQGGLNWYRCGVSEIARDILQLFRKVVLKQPTLFIAGARDWGVFQSPGAYERMQTEICIDFKGAHLIDGAGHWVQQENPDRVNRLLLDFFCDHVAT